MKLSSQRANRSTKIELSMSSMIDVVFLLLIFFMVTTSFRKTERELDPAVKTQQKSSAAESDFEPVIVEVVRAGSGTVFRLGTATYDSDTELVGMLKQFDRKQDGAYVKVSDAAEFGFAARAMQACKTAGFSAVSYIPWDGS